VRGFALVAAGFLAAAVFFVAAVVAFGFLAAAVAVALGFLVAAVAVALGFLVAVVAVAFGLALVDAARLVLVATLLVFTVLVPLDALDLEEVALALRVAGLAAGFALGLRAGAALRGEGLRALVSSARSPKDLINCGSTDWEP